MGRLKTAPSRLGKPASRLGAPPGDERARDKVRRDTQAWRSWYKAAEWQRLRLEVFARDLYTCQQTGVLCVGTGNDPNAPVCHHVEPHHGDETLFWDVTNLQTVTKAWHDSVGQAQERRGRG